MEFFDVGKQCNICSQRDYLPFQCDNCKKYYCLEHYNEHFECGIKIQKKSLEDIQKVKYKRCKLCKKEALVHCKFCQKDFCIDHRLNFDHQCEKLPKQTESSTCTIC